MNISNKILTAATSLAIVVLALASALSVLRSIDQKLNDMRAIESEIRDSNWIMACDDVSPVDAPQTFIHCNQ